MLVAFLLCVTRHLTRSSLREEVILWVETLRVIVHHSGKIRPQVHKADSHIVSGVRKQEEMNDGVQPAFSLLVQLRIQLTGWYHSEVGFHGDSKACQIGNQDYHLSRVCRIE